MSVLTGDGVIPAHREIDQMSKYLKGHGFLTIKERINRNVRETKQMSSLYGKAPRKPFKVLIFD